ncbi:MAG: mechanosensitive ion channel [bacterium]|nr:mechanosensitive ion channel [bacterium]
MTRGRTKHSIQQALIGLSLIVFLILTSILVSQISSDNVGLGYYIEVALNGLTTALVAWVSINLLKVAFWEPYEKKHGKTAPRILVSLANVAIFLSAILFFTVFILDKSPLSIAAAGGLIGGGVAFALQGPVLDAFAGAISDIQHPYRLGDWVSLKEGKIKGKVVDMNWRATTLLSHDHETYVVPNGEFIKEGFKNYSWPKNHYIDNITVSLDHDVGLDRAQRILKSAVLSVPGIVQHGDCFVYAAGVNSGGVDYCVRYYVDDHSQWRRVRHAVLHAITHQLHTYGLKISETIGEYGLIRGGNDIIEKPAMTAEDAVEKIDLFASLTDASRKKLAQKTMTLSVPEGTTLVQQGDSGDSMYLIAEGSVDIVLEGVTKKGKKEKDQHLAILGAHQFFGDMALLTGEKRSATVKARTHVIAYKVTKEALAPILKSKPELVEALATVVSQRQMDTQKTMDDAQARDQERKKAKEAAGKLSARIKQFFSL